MKKQKKHMFKHRDPEKEVLKKTTTNQTQKASGNIIPESLRLDMRRTLTLVLLFTIALAGFFVLQMGTGQPKDFFFRLFE